MAQCCGCPRPSVVSIIPWPDRCLRVGRGRHQVPQTDQCQRCSWLASQLPAQLCRLCLSSGSSWDTAETTAAQLPRRQLPAAPGAAGELASELAGQLAPQLQTCRVPSSRAQTTALHRAPEVLIPEANCNLLCNQLMVHRDLTGRSAAWGQLGLQLRS